MADSHDGSHAASPVSCPVSDEYEKSETEQNGSHSSGLAGKYFGGTCACLIIDEHFFDGL